MQIAVIGCGWLGLPLALSLQTSGYKVVATCRTQQKANQLNNLGVETEKFELGDELRHDSLEKLFASKVLVLNIPVGRKKPKTESFAKHMQALLTHAADSQIQNLIFISTTSVYGDLDGVVTEQTPTQAKTESGQINLAVEKFAKENFAEHSTIIRPSGLVGKNRHPANYLAGKTGLLNPDNMVNLVHQDDVVCAIQTVIEKELWGQTLHLCALEHPTRAEYYTWATQQLNIQPPSFVKGLGITTGKKIDATKSLQLLGLSLRYPSPFAMLKTEIEQ